MIPLFTDDVPEDLSRAVGVLYTLEEWPRDWGKDVDLVRRLKATFPSIDLAEEALAFVTWVQEWREKHPRKEIKHRARFVNWCKNAKAWSRRRARPPAPPTAHRQTGMGGW